MENLNHNNNEKFQLWHEVILDAGLQQELTEKVLALLADVRNHSTNDPGYSFTLKFADYIRENYPKCFEWDNAEKQHESLGYKNTIELSDEEQMLINLYREIRIDRDV